ncbi:HAD family hydrolase [Sediminispirochaeta bajacaliforniensis]|uniref:HAD family hydrolase n=1 Tax=Sediminispirochaeta bajacaliforniensis TaxID=148 RepID=UPI00037270E2|nr:HAD family hydrolase [Sediminispirochaeta bajacaliforniensis]
MSRKPEPTADNHISGISLQWIETYLGLHLQEGIALFDIDGTVMDTIPRNYQILKEAVSIIPCLRPIVDTIGPEACGWNVFTPLSGRIQLTDAESRALRRFWRQRFFTDSYLAYDRPYAGVREFLQAIRKQGLTIVYLTGRDKENMSAGTIASFQAHNIPVDEHTRFLFKPDAAIPDLSFKQDACRRLAENEHIVFAVENEPANANMMVEYFPGALVMLVETITSPNPAEPDPSIIRFSSYQ